MKTSPVLSILLLWIQVLYFHASLSATADESVRKDTTWVNQAQLKFNKLIDKNMIEAEQLSDDIMSVSKKLKYEKGLAIAWQEKGDIAWHKMQFDSAGFFLDSALRMAKKINDHPLIASVLTSQGINFIVHNEPEKAAEKIFASLRFCEKSGSPALIALNYENLAIVFTLIKDYDKGVSYHRKAMSLFRQINDSSKIVTVFTNYSFTLMEMKRPADAIGLLKQAASIVELSDSNWMTPAIYGNLGYGYILLDSQQTEIGERSIHLLDSAFYYLNRCEKIALRYKLYDALAPCYSDMAIIYRRKKQPHKEIEFLNKSLAYALEFHQSRHIADTYRLLYISHAEKGDYKNALKFHESYKKWNDSLIAAENIRDIQKLSSQFEVEKKENEIQLLKDQNAIQHLRTERGNILSFSLAGGMVALIVLAGSYFIQSRKRKKLNMQLQQAYTDLQKAQEKIIMQEKLSSLGLLTKKLAHEIQNPLNFVNNFSEISTELIREWREEGNEDVDNTIVLLEQNLAKINFHGKRADSIIKKLFAHLHKGTFPDAIEFDG